MKQMKFNKELYPKVALIKAAYNFTDSAYVHLDADECYYYVSLEFKDSTENITEQEFINEILTQSVRHEVYLQTKNIRELLLGRAMATSIVVNEGIDDKDSDDVFCENDILKDWFLANEGNSI